MPTPTPASRNVSPLWRALAALEAGILAGAVMLVYLMLDAKLRGAGIWSVINLLSSDFYGVSALGGAFRKTTFAGLAWLVWWSGVVGLVISLALGRFVARPLRFSLLGALLAMSWYYIVVRAVWPRVNPLAGFHQPFPGLLFAHLLFGAALGSYPRLVAALEASHGVEAQPDDTAGG